MMNGDKAITFSAAVDAGPSDAMEGLLDAADVDIEPDPNYVPPVDQDGMVEWWLDAESKWKNWKENNGISDSNADS